MTRILYLGFERSRRLSSRPAHERIPNFGGLRPASHQRSHFFLEQLVRQAQGAAARVAGLRQRALPDLRRDLQGRPAADAHDRRPRRRVHSSRAFAAVHARLLDPGARGNRRVPARRLLPVDDPQRAARPEAALQQNAPAAARCSLGHRPDRDLEAAHLDEAPRGHHRPDRARRPGEGTGSHSAKPREVRAARAGLEDIFVRQHSAVRRQTFEAAQKRTS